MRYGKYGGLLPGDEPEESSAEALEKTRIGAGEFGGTSNTNADIALKQEQAELLKAQASKTRQQTIAESLFNPNKYISGYKNGGPVIKASYKGTGPVNIGDWVAPLKSRGGK